MDKKQNKLINTFTNIILTWYRYFEKVINHRIFPDKPFLSLLYRAKFHKKLNLENPKTFNEKLQWLKLYDRKPEYITYVDKYKVREYIAQTIGKEYLIPLIGVWNNPDEIDFDKLPNQFVLKCNHDSGSFCICKNKANFNIKEAKNKLKKSLFKNFYIKSREWVYKKVPRKIIAEKYIIDETDNELRDYKVMVFNGKAHYVRVCFNRMKKTGLNINWYDLNWNYCNIRLVEPPDKSIKHPKPECLTQMIELSERLAKNIPFARIDWYIVNGKLYFGEITLFPNGGFGDFEPQEYDSILGNLIEIPIRN